MKTELIKNPIIENSESENIFEQNLETVKNALEEVLKEEMKED